MPSTVSKPASKFRTVLGLGQVQRTSHDSSLDLPANPATTTIKRKQLSTAIFAGPNPPRRSEELAATPLATALSMPSTTQRHRPPVAANQDGPWSVSAAEVPNDPHTYSIYIKSMFSSDPDCLGTRR